jgi:hypothetical protein
MVLQLVDQRASNIDIADLKQQVAGIFEQYLQGTIKIDGLLQNLDFIGVKIDCTREQLERIRATG